jgi:PEP-CTERM motif-containing protein
MKNIFKLTSLLGVSAFLALASSAASAGIISFSFTNTGYIDSVGPSCGPGCVLVETTGHATETGGLAGANDWSFSGVMQFYQDWSSGLGYGVGSGLGWSFTDTDGNNNLYGNFTQSVDGNLFDIVRPGTVQYTILGGSGMFDGAKGSGSSSITYFLSSFFTEVGSMLVVTKPVVTAVASVPEPAISTLLFAGLGMAGFMAWRRRRATTQI